jgi:H+-translocating NAD(P) transhydrogenase subunit alpha
MYDDLMANLAILVLAGFVGFAVISKVPNTLHTPLMSGTNAIHGIVVLGALLVLGTVEHPTLAQQIILFVALVFGTLNVIGGFIVTDRMLGMFKAKKRPPAAPGGDAGHAEGTPPEGGALTRVRGTLRRRARHSVAAQTNGQRR